MENNVPYAVYEGSQVRHERTVKRLIIALIINLILFFATNALWIYEFNQYDYIDQTQVEQRTEGEGDVNYIGASGDIIN